MKFPKLPSSVKSALIVALVSALVAACSTFTPILDDALKVICRVTQGDAGVNISLHYLYPDGSTAPIDATVIQD